MEVAPTLKEIERERGYLRDVPAGMNKRDQGGRMVRRGCEEL